jgi:hypothetical protein
MSIISKNGVFVKYLVENVISREIALIHSIPLGIHPSSLTKEILRLRIFGGNFIEIIILICLVYVYTTIVKNPGPCCRSNGWFLSYVYLTHEILLS